MQLRWLLLGAAASLLPLCSAFAMTRLTVAPGFAFHACLAVFVTHAVARLQSATSITRRIGYSIALLLIASVHVVVSASRSYAASVMYAGWSIGEQAWMERAQFDVPSLADRRVFVLSALDSTSQYALPFVLHFLGPSAPDSSHLLLPPGLSSLELRRSADNALEVTAADGNGHFGFLSSAYRRADASFAEGQHFSNPLFRVEVVRVVDGVPSVLRYVFARPLNDPSYVFMYPRPEGSRRLVLPGLGESQTLPPPAVARVDVREAGR